MDCKFIVLLLSLAVGACSGMENPDPAGSVPDRLKPSANESLAMIVAARGAQIYECRATKEQAGIHEWTLVAPEATLFDAKGKKIGRHYAGPHWESTDGSKIVGTVKERVDAPQADAIPWLLLATKSVGAQGSFSRITSVQRVNTVGGIAPKTGCSQSAAGMTVQVPYSAVYYFLAEKNQSLSSFRASERPVVRPILTF